MAGSTATLLGTPQAPQSAATKGYVDSVGINAQTGTAYTLALTDVGLIVECANAAAVTVTIPTNATVAFPVGTVLEVMQTGAGKVTVAGASGVTVNAPGGLLGTRVQWSSLMLRKRATDTWVLVGDTA